MPPHTGIAIEVINTCPCMATHPVVAPSSLTYFRANRRWMATRNIPDSTAT